jgi:3'-5' exoribonuclease
MKSPFVRDIAPDQAVHTTFLVQAKEIRQKKSGDPFLCLTLADRTGDLDAKMWDNVAEVMDTFDRDDFVKVKGQLQIFHNRPQLTIHKMHRVGDHEINLADYFPASERDPDEMMAELRGVVGGIGNPHLKALLNALLDDPDIGRRFKTAPAAKSIHHAYLGGLIEHVLSVCSLCRITAPLYKLIDLDLLLTGAILHDIGKIYELSYERGFSYSNEGQLLGHMVIALRMIGDKVCALPGFPPKLRILVEHMVISHHGHLEYGSPKLPQFPEALLLHYLDDLDSKMACARSLIEQDKLVEGEFTQYHAVLDRPLLKKARYLEDKPPAARPEPPKTPVPQRPPAEPVQAHPARVSVFGEKLLQAVQQTGDK